YGGGGRARTATTRFERSWRSDTMTVFGIPTQALFGQLLIGLINGAFYAMLSLGLSVIFGLLNIINFAHGAQYMMGAFVAYFALQRAGLGYWPSLLIAPLVVGCFGVVIERTMLKRLYHLDHLYGLLLTFGVALVVQGLFRNEFGSSPAHRRLPPRLHVPAHLSGLGGRLLARRLPRHLVRDRADEAGRLSARRDRESHARAGLRHQCPVHDHAHVWIRRRPRRARR